MYSLAATADMSPFAGPLLPAVGSFTDDFEILTYAKGAALLGMLGSYINQHEQGAVAAVSSHGGKATHFQARGTNTGFEFTYGICAALLCCVLCPVVLCAVLLCCVLWSQLL